MGLKVVVTGASSGIGRAIALKFSKDGHDVFATGRSEKNLAETVHMAKENGGSTVFPGIGDVGVEADVEKNYAGAVKALGGEIDVAVLNAGVTTAPAFLEEFTTEEYDDIFNANVRGVFLWLKAILPAFKKRGSGQIVIINSVGGEKALAKFGLYVASKFAVTGLAQALRLELQGSGIKVGSLFPGVVDTNIFSSPVWDKKGISGRELFGVDKAALSPNDVAEAVAFIAYQSPRSDIDKISLWQAMHAV